MLEAVNSVLSNASYTKAIADQQSVATSFAANPDRIQQATTQAPYISLYIKVDVNFNKALLQLRDSDTGDVVETIPSEIKLEAYRRAQSVAARQDIIPDEDMVEISTPDVPDVQAAPVRDAGSAPVATTTAPTTTPQAAPTTTAATTVSVNTSA